MRSLLMLLSAVLLSAVPFSASCAEVVINAVGDVMLAGKWTALLEKRGYDHPFAATLSELGRGDINLANLESPIARQGSEFTTKKYRFRAQPALAPALRKAGFHLVTLANNHSMDFGAPALTETFRHLKEAGIAWIGAGETLADARKMAIFTLNGKRIAFLGYSLTQPTEFFAAPRRAGTVPGWERIYTEDIARARRAADYVVVTFHWGTEGSNVPRPYQRETAHKAIDAGADAVIGHHPHVLQGLERYKNGIIFYSLGNFAFASTSRTADVAALVRLRLGDGVRQAEIIPLDVLAGRVGFQPRVLTGDKALAVIRKLNRLSEPFDTMIPASGDQFVLSF